MNNNIVVVDASLALKWVTVEQDTDKAEHLLNRWGNAGTKISVPALFVYEITNIIYRKTVTRELLLDEALLILTKMFSMGVLVDFSSHEYISTQAMMQAHRFGLPAAYDAHYLALSMNKGCEFWTADKRLWNAVKGKLAWVRWLADYEITQDT